MTQHKLGKVLIANRGEIAVRVQRACRKLGISSVLVVSEPDLKSYAARVADEVFPLGGKTPKESYLDIKKIILAAKKTGCDGIHPGYGFLSENSDFAQAVRDAGLVFVGPKPETIRLLGSKTGARAEAARVNVPHTPGTEGSTNLAELTSAAKQIGYPAIVKAVAGGGGRGMRVVRGESELEEALARASAEAEKNFGNGAIYLERFIDKPRHVEVQLLGDDYGNIIHLGTRDCSTQRRHQKLVEEAPAPDLSVGVRSRIENAAVRLASAVGYRNAGTAEFLVLGEEYFFLEMNTRIQVEHPVTEEVTGVDLVELQLRIASGDPLPISQPEVKFLGHAIEFRLYAEDPLANFIPCTGKIEELQRPAYPFLREEYGFESGDEVTPFYDAMLSKIIIRGGSRLECIDRAYAALREFKITGIRTNLDFHRWLLRCSPFRNGPVDIGYLGREFSAESLKQLAAYEVKDPRHRPPINGMLEKDLLEYRSERFGITYTIQVVHRPEGTFEASAVDARGRLARRKYRRQSNGFRAAVRSLTEEVLNVIHPLELFPK